MPAKFDRMVEHVKESLRKKNPKMDDKELNSRAYAIATSTWKEMHNGKAPNGKGHKAKSENKFCFVSNIEYKAIELNGTKEHHISGFVSAPYIDNDNDFIPESLQSKLVKRINRGFANRTSYNHDFILNNNWLPVATAKAELKLHPKLNKLSTWVDVILDEDSPKFNEILNNIQNVKGFSIEYADNFPYHHEQLEGKLVRIFDDIPAFGLSIVGSPMTPVNPMATADGGYEYKAYFDSEEEDEDDELTDDDISKLNKNIGDVTMEQEDKKENVEAKAEGKAQDKELEEFRAWKQQQEKSKQFTDFKGMFQEAFKAELKAMSLTQPYFNPEGKFGNEMPGFDAELKAWRETNQRNDVSLDAKYEAAARLHNALEPYGITQRTISGAGAQMKARLGLKKSGRDFEISGKAMQEIKIKGAEYKAQLEHDTNKVSDADYYQNAAELNDIYDPVIISHLNDKTTLWGLMKKKNVSNIGSDRYGFRIWRTRIEGAGGSTSAYYYDEAATLTGYNAAMLKCQIPFMQYGVTVQVSGLMIAEARGSIGDVFAKQLQRATADLGRGINLDLYGTAVGMTDGGAIMGLEVIGDDGGTYANIYGHAKATYTTLQGTDNAQTGSPNIDKTLLRTALRTPEKNGAPREQLIFVTDQIQRDKMLGMLDPAQRFNNASAQAGFEGLPTFDGRPIHADDQCNDGYLYVLPMDSYYAAVLQAPTFEDLAKTDDSKKGFIKTYFAVVCENPNWVYKITGLNTA